MRPAKHHAPDEDFLPLDVSTLRLDVTTKFALYMKRGDAKPVLYRGKNTQFTSDVLDNLRRNNVTYLYVSAEDSDEYHEYLTENFSDMLEDPTVPLETKCELGYEATSRVIEDAFEAEPDPEKLANTTEKIIGPLAKTLIGSGEAVKKFVSLTSQDDVVYKKSLNMFMLGILLVRKMLGIRDNKQLTEIGLGFLFCDLAMTKWPTEILRRRGALLPEEWEVVKRHPEKALELLQEYPLSEEARIIIAQHHERSDGSGYPKGLKGDEIHVLAKIAALVETFAALNSNRPFANQRKTFDALSLIKDEMINHVGMDLFAHFVQIFSVGNPLQKLRGPS
ncbi:MAG: HD domain-containing phosphohydrolase [bacterium]